MTACGWPFGYVSDGGFAAFPYYWCGGDTVYNTLGLIGDTQGDRIWLTGDGILNTEARTATDSLAGSFLQSDILVNIPRSTPWSNMWNVVSVEYNNIQTWDIAIFGGVSAWGDKMGLKLNVTSISSQAYTYATLTTAQIQIPANSSIIISGNYSDGVTDTDITQRETAIGGVIYTPFSRTYIYSLLNSGNVFSYKFFTGSGGTGNEITGYVKNTLFQDGGNSFKVILKNTLNATAYSNGMLVFGHYPYYISSSATNSFIVDNSGGKSQKVFTVSSPYMFGTLAQYGIKIASYFSSIVSTSSTFPTITFEGRPDVQYLQMGDRINVNLALYNLSSDYRVGAIDEQWISQNGQAVQTTITTEPYVVATG